MVGQIFKHSTIEDIIRFGNKIYAASGGVNGFLYLDKKGQTISDTVNTAARIESLTKYYGVNILLTESCLSKLDNGSTDTFQLRYLGKVQVKGKQQAIKIHECFDGDLPEVIVSKNEYQDNFKSALHSFHNQEFTMAVANLSQIVTKNPTDKTACLFFSKANQLMINGVDEGWTGVEAMTVK